MTEFELSLAEALRNEAEEIAMRTDQQLATEELNVRLDRADRANRRRHMWYAAGAAAVAALVVVAAVVFSQEASRTDGVGPTTPDTPESGVPYAATFLRPPAELVLPSWTQHADGEPVGTAALFEEASCAGLGGASPCPSDADLKLRLFTLRYFYPGGGRSVVQYPSYSEYVAAIESLEPAGIATITDQSTLTVGGRPATAISLEVLRDAPGAVSCPFPETPAESCAPLIAGRAVRMAVVNQRAEGLPPTVFYLSLNGDAPDRADRFAEFDTMLDTVAWD
ncbi:hypothetical protein GON03_17695 [Nocardioides sp. MAH-18]|uniref:Uncharacterized protein n=1 Tax=Nocardioides agri TaxID=2682843 RepID=A0A6L6XWE5_9ACTN|nr:MULTISPECIES: hypothetical protein [unclassified Nocardioides]MBA2956178.1 hypothetical protein [Nocardioides sp. CGMCC 1.13656]MVQ51023.1 hypothetical protein [Nocardioides sp. MAH-18]